VSTDLRSTATSAQSASDEAQRLAAVRRYDVLDTPPDGAFERITSLAATLFKVPIAIVSIVDTDRIWFKSHHGLDVEQIDRAPGLCASAILQDGPWVVEDAAVDPRTLTNPLVAGDFGLRFYAGVPLQTNDGFNLGTLCIIDKEPRELAAREVEMLEDLAGVVMDELELRLSARRSVALEAESRQMAEDLARTLQDSLLPLELPAVRGLEFATRYHVAFRDRVGGDFYDVIPTDAGCAVVIGDVCGKGAKAAALTGTARWTVRTASLNAWTPAKILARLNDVIARAYENPERYLTIAFADIRPREAGADIIVSLGGHPHPVILRHTGAVERIGVTAPIVGWKSGVSFTDASARLNSGDVLVLFTDGLQDSIGGRDAASDAVLHEVLGSVAGGTAEEVADRLDQLIGDDMRDDVAFLIVRIA